MIPNAKNFQVIISAKSKSSDLIGIQIKIKDKGIASKHYVTSLGMNVDNNLKFGLHVDGMSI